MKLSLRYVTKGLNSYRLNNKKYENKGRQDDGPSYQNVYNSATSDRKTIKEAHHVHLHFDMHMTYYMDRKISDDFIPTSCDSVYRRFNNTQK